MQLTPRYGDAPIITLDGDPAAIAAPAIRQRRRLVDLLGGFSEDRWSSPSRCAGWSTRDVVTHLHSTNQFWSFSIALGLKGEPTRFLATFDPVATPAQLVADAPPQSDADLLDQFAASTAALEQQLGSLDDAGWRTTAEAPCGHVSISALAHHALWDSLVHERDIVVPLGIPPTEEPDEVGAALRYAAALSPAFALSRGAAHPGTLGIEPTDGADAACTVRVDGCVAVTTGAPAADEADLVLRGTAVDLLEGLSLRVPIDPPVPAGASWWIDGLRAQFDQAP